MKYGYIRVSTKEQDESYASLPRDSKGRIVSRKKNKVVGKPNILDNIKAEQRRIIGLWANKHITLNECINLTKFSRATIYKLKANLFPELNIKKEITEDIKSFIKKWENKEISTKDCIRLTGFSRSHLYKLKKN